MMTCMYYNSTFLFTPWKQNTTQKSVTSRQNTTNRDQLVHAVTTVISGSDATPNAMYSVHHHKLS